MNKKKLLVIALALCLIATLSFTTLAWFTDTDTATNTFTIGSVEIEVQEDFEAPEAMLPIVNTEKPEEDPNFVKKVAWIANTGDNAAYVQAFVAVPAALDNVGAFHLVEANQNYWIKVDGDPDTDGYQPVDTATIGGVPCNIYKYVYKDMVHPGTSTLNVISGAYMDPALDYNGTYFIMDGTEITTYTPGTAISVYVAGQAIQSQGFGSYTEALANFGDTHPWSN